MKLTDLFEDVLKTEFSCLEFLRAFGMFSKSAAICPGKPGALCTRQMNQNHRKTKKKGSISFYWRCTRKHCNISKTIRKTNRFFAYQGSDKKAKGNLSLRNILLIVYHFVYGKDTLDELEIKTGHSRPTLCDWLNFCREVCTTVVRRLPKMVGTTEQTVQIDESYFRGKRKYNKGRLLIGDQRAEEEKRLKEEMKKKEGIDYELGKVVGPWVFGLYMCPTRMRFYVVHDRTGDTLLPLIEANVEKDSTVVSDE